MGFDMIKKVMLLSIGAFILLRLLNSLCPNPSS